MRIAFVGIQTTELLTFRREMLRAMAAPGHDVLAIAPEHDAAVEAKVAQMGVQFAQVRLHRAGLNPIRDSLTTVSLFRILRRFRPDAVLLTAAKPIVFGALAARLARVPMRAAMITGIGSALAEAKGVRRRLLARLVRLLYRLALRQVHVVFFQNGDDQQLFRDLGLVGPRQQLVRIAGSGIDLEEFTPTELPPLPVTFLMVARLLRDKGLHEFVAAATRVRQAHPEARFQLLGPFDPNPEGITQADLDAIRSGGVVEYLGVTDDVRPFIAAAHVAVLPSYREGTPRSNLEAMGMARPVITTDAPGCRETVEPGVSGLIVPARDAEALAAAMTELLEHPEQLAAMGRAGRELAEQRFDVREVNRTIMAAMGIPEAAVDARRAG